MSELKILIHIGHHLNVVNLLGACTKPGGKFWKDIQLKGWSLVQSSHSAISGLQGGILAKAWKAAIEEGKSTKTDITAQ